MSDKKQGCMTTGKFPPETVLGSKEYFMDREAKMKAQIAALTEANEKLKSTTVCVYCGKKLITENGKDKLAMIIDHMSLCEKHPVNKISGLLVEIDRLTADKKELVEGLSRILDVDEYTERRLIIRELIAKHGK